MEFKLMANKGVRLIDVDKLNLTSLPRMSLKSSVIKTIPMDKASKTEKSTNEAKDYTAD